MKTLTAVVYGKVQGVNYRASTQKKAEELGLSGTVKNESNGTVLIRVTGTDPVLNEFLAWCKRGPEQAEVEKVEVKESKTEVFSGFKILWNE